jgi:hypothetical protein
MDELDEETVDELECEECDNFKAVDERGVDWSEKSKKSRSLQTTNKSTYIKRRKKQYQSHRFWFRSSESGFQMISRSHPPWVVSSGLEPESDTGKR